MVEAHHCAIRFVRDFIDRLGQRDWRAWILRASDKNGEELFLMPFWYMVEKPL
jgi:hypothetical protein